jgi:hypothetical protein
MYFHKDVECAAAIGRPDKRVGEVPVLYVQLKKDASVDTDELMRFVKARISERAAIPKEIILIDKIPETTIGKVFKPALIEKELQLVMDKGLKELSLQANYAIESNNQIGRHVLFSKLAPADQQRITDHFQDYSVVIRFEK